MRLVPCLMIRLAQSLDSMITIDSCIVGFTSTHSVWIGLDVLRKPLHAYDWLVLWSDTILPMPWPVMVTGLDQNISFIPPTPLSKFCCFLLAGHSLILFIFSLRNRSFFLSTAPVFQWFCLFYWALNLLLQIKMCCSVFLYYCSNRIATSTNKRMDEEYHRINPR